MQNAILSVEDLEVTFATDGGPLRAAAGVSFALGAGRSVGLVGESGCGKTMTALAVLGLVPPPGRITGGAIRFDGIELTGMGEGALDAIRGNRISMIFQEPMTSLNPVFTVGEQIAEVLRVHRGASRAEAMGEAVDMLGRVGIPDAVTRARAFPHHLSGGMRQRAMIAMALACRPDVLIADEPTTALDVTVQAQILDLMLDVQRDMGMALLFISHNLAVVEEVADEVMVMYAGRIVEAAPASALFARPLHPYTRGLIETLPQGPRQSRLPAIPGSVPDLRKLPPGCAFAPRCALADDACRSRVPGLEAVAEGRRAACCKVEP